MGISFGSRARGLARVASLLIVLAAGSRAAFATDEAPKTAASTFTALETQINTCMTAKIGLADNSKAPAGTKPADAVKPAADAGKAPATTGTLPAAKPAAPAAAK